jgi:cytochrome c biogenesis protein CcmG/thiol:disulfide interchange protein DsbE
MTSTDSTSPATRSRPAWGAALVWMGLLGLLALVGFGLIRTQQGPVGVGSAMPDFTLTTFDGDVYDTAQERGRVLVVNFWASWCKPCEQEAAELENTWRHYKDRGVMFLGVDYVDTETAALAYLKRFDVTYPNGPDLGTKISQAFRIRGVPETYILDQNGRLVGTKIGPTTQADLQAVIEPLLK